MVVSSFEPRNENMQSYRFLEQQQQQQQAELSSTSNSFCSLGGIARRSFVRWFVRSRVNTSDVASLYLLFSILCISKNSC